MCVCRLTLAVRSCPSITVDVCYAVYHDLLTEALIPADQPLPPGAIRHDAKKGQDGARKETGGASRKGEPSHAFPCRPHPSPHPSLPSHHSC